MKLYCVLFCLAGVLAPTPEEIHTSGISPTYPVRETIQGRISGGEKVKTLQNFPYITDIVAYGRKYCVGFIISERYILTAAHCVEMEGEDDERFRRRDAGTLPKNVVVRAGSLYRGQGTRISISEIVLHPYFDRPQNNFDIAYMKTKKSIVFNKNIQPGKLGKGKLPTNFTVVGWGKRGRQGYNRRLRKVNLTLRSVIRCIFAYPMVQITQNMFCAEDPVDLDKGACQGDGGAPASHDGLIYGASTFTRGCGMGMLPSVFTYLQTSGVRTFITNGTGVQYQNKSIF